MDIKYLMGVLKYVLSTLFSIGIAVFLMYHIINSISTEIETSPIVYTTQEEVTAYDAYIFRNESLLYTDPSVDGNMNFLCEDGTRVSANDKVCQVYAGSTSEEEGRAIQDIERKLDLLKNSNLDESIKYSDTQLIDTSIFNAYYTLLTRMEEGNSGYAMAKADELIASMNQRQIVTKHVENFDAEIEALEKQRTDLVTGSGKIAQTILSGQSGFYYSDIDGFENIFDSKKLANMTLDQFDKLVSSEADMSLQKNADGGVNCGKIVTDYNWYIGCRITNEDSRAFTEGYTYTVIFPYNSDLRITMVLDRIILQADDDRVVLIFRTNSIPEHFNFLRRQTVQIVTSTYEGYKIPIESVRILDGIQGVYILEGYVVQFRRIEPIREINGFFICRVNDGSVENADMLALFDRIITKGKNLYVGKIIS